LNAEAFLAAVLSFVSVVLFFYAFKILMRREINMARFAPGSPNQVEPTFEQKNKKIKEVPPLRVLMLILAGGISCGVIAYAVVGKWWFTGIASSLGLLAPNLWLSWHRKSKKALLANQLERAAEVMSAVLKSGGGMNLALDKAISEVDKPLKNELAQVLAEIHLGVPLEVAFRNLNERVNLDDLSLLATAADLQSTGMAVNMATVLEQIRENIKGKQLFEDEVSAITGENKMAAWIVGVIPFVLIGLFRQMAPDFVAPLFETAVGIAVFVICLVVILFGIVWAISMTKIEYS